MQHYKSIDIIGEGSFGSVYLIKDSKDRSYALKKIHSCRSLRSWSSS